MGPTISRMSSDQVMNAVSQGIVRNMQANSSSADMAIDIGNNSVNADFGDIDIMQSTVLSVEAFQSTDNTQDLVDNIVESLKQSAETSGAMLGILSGLGTSVSVSQSTRSNIENMITAETIQKCVVQATQNVRIGNNAYNITTGNIKIVQDVSAKVLGCTQSAMNKGDLANKIAVDIQQTSKVNNSSVMVVVIIIVLLLALGGAAAYYKKKHPGAFSSMGL
jgi:hypothetical protein